MAIPSTPTLASLVSEALKKAGQSTPDAALVTRAQDQWMEEIKNDVFLASAKVQKKLRSLFATSNLVATVGVHRYSLPSDYGSDLTVSILDGDTTGILQAATSSTATLSATETITADAAEGEYLLIISGTGKSSCSQMRVYNATTFVANVTPDFNTTPVTGDGYRVITEQIYLPSTDALQLDMIRNITTPGRPTKYTTFGDQDYGEILFDFVPDDTYGIQLRYYVDLSLTDLAGTRISTLYRKWRNVFLQGVYAKALSELHDAKADAEMKKYYEYLALLIEEETSGQDLGEVQFQIDR